MDQRWPAQPNYGAAHPARLVDAFDRERAQVLDAVRHSGAATRPQIALATGLSRAVVQQRLGELVAAGLVGEGGTEASSGGRPPKLLRFRADAGYVLAADLGATSIDVAACDLAGRLLRHDSEAADIGAGPAAVLGRVETLFDRLAADPVLAGRAPWGIGVGLPGPVEFATGRPVSPPIMPGWDGYPVRERLAARFDIPVWVDNDVNVMALGERTDGVARDHENVIFVKVGTGIGAGLLSHGNLHRGALGSAGDMGHIQAVTDPTVRCRCGKTGCLEAVAGGAALAREADRLVAAGESPALTAALSARGVLSAIDVVTAASHGDLACIALLQEAGRLIGGRLAAAVNFFNPSLIVVGGGVANAGDYLLAAIREVVHVRSTPLATRHLLIQRSALGGRAGVIGAAAMVLAELFAPERQARWIEAAGSSGIPELAQV